jgi:hypothetical protein
MMCFFNSPGSSPLWPVAADIPPLKSDGNDQDGGLTVSGSLAVSASQVIETKGAMAATIDAVVSQAPSALLEFAQTTLDSIIANLEDALATFQSMIASLSAGKRFIATQALENLLTPILQLCKDVRPYTEGVELKTGSASAGLIPPELFLLGKAILAKAKRGGASPNELLAASVIMDIQEMVSSLSPDDDDDDDDNGSAQDRRSREVATGDQVDPEVVERLFNRLLLAIPDLFHPDALAKAGFSQRAQMTIRSRVGDPDDICGETFAKLLVPYLDQQSWQEMSAPLEDVIQVTFHHPLFAHPRARSSWLTARVGTRSVSVPYGFSHRSKQSVVARRFVDSGSEALFC